MRRVYLRRRVVALAGVGAVIAAIVLAVEGIGGGRAGRAVVTAHRMPSVARGAANARAARRVSLPLSELAGERVIYAYSGLTPPSSLLDAIRAGEAAGVILFGPNVSSPAQVRGVVAELQRAAAASRVHAPLLILADQEGGQVRRLPGAPELSERAIGEASGSAQLAADAGTGAARNLAAAGANVNLSPVLDVLRQPDDFIDQFHRSYGSDPAQDGRLGAAFIEAQQGGGVAATAKHFPGLGAAKRGQDTDSRAVTLDVPLAELRSVDEAPFQDALAAGVKLVMTSWAIYPALDPSRPAGLSARVIGGELRGRLGYRGVTITDTLSAAALAPYGTLASRGLLAARAGADLLICSAINGNDDPSDGLAVLHALRAAIADGQLSRASAEQAAARVLALRAQERVEP
jgi:beta-N-acetylhexosaminidase